MLHIELSGDAGKLELRAVRALIDTLLGETAMTPVHGENAAPETVIHTPKGSTVIGTDADRPLDPAHSATVVPPPPATDTAQIAPSPAAVTPPPANGVELDSSGLPWDERIHGEGKNKNKDGTWRSRRNLDAGVKAQVEADLRKALAAPAATVVPPPPPAEEGPAVTDPAAAFGAPTPPPPPPVEAAAPPPPPTEAASAATEFARVMRAVTAKQKAGILNTEMTGVIAQQLGLTAVRDLMARPDLIPAFEAMLPE